jgi:hypothetical protein
MNQQQPQSGGATAPPKVTGEDILKMFSAIQQQLDFIRQRLDGLENRPVASTATNGEIEIVEVVSIIKAFDQKGEPMYHAQGGRYMKHGARIWPENFENIKIDPESLAIGPNKIKLRVVVKPTDGKHAPKVIDLA